LFISQKIVDELENFRTGLKIKLNEMETETEEQEQSAAEASERERVACEEHDKRLREVEDLKAEVASVQEKAKNDEEVLKSNLKRLEEKCTDLVSRIPSVLEAEEKLKKARENVQSMKDHILYAEEQACSFFQEYDAMHEDLIQKLEGQLMELSECVNQNESKDEKN
jgi:hypothetical protein